MEDLPTIKREKREELPKPKDTKPQQAAIDAEFLPGPLSGKPYRPVSNQSDTSALIILGVPAGHDLLTTINRRDRCRYARYKVDVDGVTASVKFGKQQEATARMNTQALASYLKLGLACRWIWRFEVNEGTLIATKYLGSQGYGQSPKTAVLARLTDIQPGNVVVIADTSKDDRFHGGGQSIQVKATHHKPADLAPDLATCKEATRCYEQVQTWREMVGPHVETHYREMLAQMEERIFDESQRSLKALARYLTFFPKATILPRRKA